jgi:hypothetical protein
VVIEPHSVSEDSEVGHFAFADYEEEEEVHDVEDSHSEVEYSEVEQGSAGVYSLVGCVVVLQYVLAHPEEVCRFVAVPHLEEVDLAVGYSSEAAPIVVVGCSSVVATSVVVPHN